MSITAPKNRRAIWLSAAAEEIARKRRAGPARSGASDPGGRGFPVDQRGGPRHTDGDCDDTVRCDMGAFELTGCGMLDLLRLYVASTPEKPAADRGPVTASPVELMPESGTVYYWIEDGFGYPPTNPAREGRRPAADALLADDGVEIVDGLLAGLCSRAVVVLDAGNKVVYNEQVPEIGQEPNYAAALGVLK